MKAEPMSEASTTPTAISRRQRGEVAPCGWRQGGVVKALHTKKYGNQTVSVSVGHPGLEPGTSRL